MYNPTLPQGSTRRPWLILVWIAAIALLVSGCGAPTAKVYRVGILSGLDVFATTADGFKAKMTELGYVEGQNIIYDIQKTNSDREAEQRILQQFVKDKVDLMLVFPSEAAVAAKAVTEGSNIPVVFCQTNIEGTNIIKSVGEPGGNLTGVRYPGPDLAIKRFEILHELVPQAKRMWVPYSTASLIVPDQLAALRPVAAQAGVTLVETPAATGDEMLADLEARTKASDIGFEAILLISEPLARTPAVFPKIGKFAAEHHIPIGGVQFSMEGYTTLFGVATNNIAVGSLAAQQADKVLKGIAPGTIPVLSAESYFQLNYKVAQEYGLTVPEGLLRSANDVIRE
jgi:putative ABC transport system substrate-binding protein